MDDEIIVPGMSERELFIRRRVKRLAEFYRHLTMYIVVMSVVWIAGLILMREAPRSWWGWWMIWPTFGWGIAVFAHGLSVLPRMGFFSLDWEEKKVRQLMQQTRGEDKA